MAKNKFSLLVLIISLVVLTPFSMSAQAPQFPVVNLNLVVPSQAGSNAVSEPESVMITAAEDFISCGQTRAGTIDFSGEQDLYNFSGSTGNVVVIAASSQFGFTAVIADVFDPLGAMIAQSTPNGLAMLTLPQSGTYTILVRSSNATIGGLPYGVSLQFVRGQCGAAIACGQSLDGRIDLAAEHDPYTFNGITGNVVVIAASSQFGFTAVFAEVFDPSGAEISETPPNGSISLTLPQNGTYTVLVRSSNLTIGGLPYGISLQFVQGQCGTGFPCGQSLQGNIDIPADHDPYTFRGSTGNVIVLAASSQFGFTAVVAEAFDPSGTKISQSTPNGMAMFTLPQNGTYTILVSSSNPTIGGLPYGVSLQFVQGQCQTAQFSSASSSIAEGMGTATITVARTGSSSGAAAVDYKTSDTSGVNNCNVFSGIASSRCDYISAIGTLRFAAGETSKTIPILIVDDAYAEGNETFTITLSNPTGASLGTPASATVTITDNDTVTGPNPIDQALFFVRQHYLDFLNRQPDAAGLAFWTNEITSCGTDAQCIEIKGINVSAAFFLSIEFQETGFLVYRMYKAAYGETTSPNVAIPVPIIRLNEFLPDAQRLGQGVHVGIGDWQTQLENNKNAYAREFVVRQRFLTAYPLTMTPTQFVDKLNLTAGGVLSATERQQLIDELIAAADVTQGRASVTRKVAEDADLRQGETTRAFVLMQYYGYLRRNPDDPQDTDFRGWEFWLNKLNQFNGNFVQAEMVKAFLLSIEYRQRFGP